MREHYGADTRYCFKRQEPEPSKPIRVPEWSQDFFSPTFYDAWKRDPMVFLLGMKEALWEHLSSYVALNPGGSVPNFRYCGIVIRIDAYNAEISFPFFPQVFDQCQEDQTKEAIVEAVFEVIGVF